MEAIRLITACEAATEAAGDAVAGLLDAGDILLLSGDLGAGKTHLTKGVARGLGIREPVTSPTFNILLLHAGGRLPLYHIDLYRLQDAEQLEGVGYFEALESGGVAVVEWGDRFPEAQPPEYLGVRMRFVDDEEREIELVGHGARGEALAAAWAAALHGLAGVSIEGLRS